MKVHGKISTEVFIDPLQAIEAIIEHSFPNDYHLVPNEDGKFVKQWTYPMGHDDHTELIGEVSEEEYEYYKALLVVRKWLAKEHDGELQNWRRFEKFKEETKKEKDDSN